MNLAPGDRLSHYEILSELGRGGMGAVYRARDTRLGREVALKVSAEQFSERFEREARVIASLNHTNICTLFDVGPNYLVMELIEGEAPNGPLPVETVLDYARQMADALDYAHERGITHRDLKPANLKVTPDGKLKVLDFGLAKIGQAVTSTDSENSPTLTMGVTQAGMILGTAAYMAPEQARGKPVDKRADIWAFGVVLYELSTGKRPFAGEDVGELLASVLRDAPSLDAIPERLRPLLSKCLEKEPRKRLRDMGDAMTLLDASGSARVVEKVVEKLVVEKAPASKSPVLMIVAAGMALTAAVVFWWSWRRPAAIEQAVTRLNVDLGLDAIAADYNTFAISPDGRRLVYTVRTPNGGTQLATRLLDSKEETRLPGSEGAQNPFFSPTGQDIGYFAGQQLMRASVRGGPPQPLADATNGTGGVWTPDNQILSANGYISGLTRIASNGGTSTALTNLTDLIITHRWPSYAAKANAVLFTAATTVSSMADAELWIQSLSGGEPKVLVRGAYAGRILETDDGDYVLYARDGVLFGSAFDSKTLSLTGETVPLVEDLAGDPTPGSGHYDVSPAGTLVYRAGQEVVQTWPVLLMDKNGKTTTLISEPALYMTPRFSPDGTKLAISSRQRGQLTLNVVDLEQGSVNKVQNAGYPVWSPDGKYLAVRDSTPPGIGLAWYRADGAGERQILFRNGQNMSSYAFTPDGKTLIFHASVPRTSTDVMALPLDLSDPDHPKAGTVRALVDTPAAEMFPSLSKDGKWLAYGSNESGRNEIYVKPFNNPGGGRWQVSTNGGRWPMWAPDGRSLYFQSLDFRIMVSQIGVSGSAITHSQPQQWSSMPLRNAGDNLSYAIHPDGQRFAVFPVADAPPESKGNAHVTFVLHFVDELRRKIAAAK